MTAMISLRAAADRNWRRAGIAAAFQGDAVIDRPCQYRAEQDHAAKIAIGAQMGEGPGLHADQQRMFEHALDVAGDIGGGDHDARRPHQRDHDVAGPGRRIPYDDETGSAITGKSVANQKQAEDRDQREQAAVRPFADFGDQIGAMIAHRHKNMRAEKNDQADNFDRKSGSKSHDKRQSLLYFTSRQADVRAYSPRRRDHGQRPSIVNEANIAAAGAAARFARRTVHDRARAIWRMPGNIDETRILAGFAVLLGTLAAAAQDWPAKTVKIIVPFAPGATPDLVARLIADYLRERLQQTFIVENKPGANGNTGTGEVARAEPDGATLGVSIGGPLAINTLLFSSLPYDPRKDLSLISMLVTQPSALAVNASLGVNYGARTDRSDPAQSRQIFFRVDRRRIAVAFGDGGDRTQERYRTCPRPLPVFAAGDDGADPQ